MRHMSSDKRKDWEKLAEKESRGRDLSRETVEGIELHTVYGAEDDVGRRIDCHGYYPGFRWEPTMVGQSCGRLVLRHPPGGR